MRSETTAVAIEDISADFFAFWTQIQYQPFAEQQRLWLERYERPHQDIFDLYYRRWGKRANLEPALARFAQHLPDMHAGVLTVKHLIQATAAPCAQLFTTDAAALRYVVMVGLFGSDGWTTRLRDQPTCFCALEYVTPERRMDVLLAHESAHGFHGHTSTFDLETTTIGEGLFLEGLAVWTSAGVIPAANAAIYLWFGNSHTSQGQPCTDWLSECTQQWSYVRHRILEDFTQTDVDTFARYFWANPALLEAGIPVRVGYFMGYQLVARLSQHYTLAEMARWLPQEATDHMQHMLYQLPTLATE